MTFENPFEKIIRIAQAQESGTVVSPTLPVDPNIGNPNPPVTITGTPTPSEGGSTALITKDSSEELDVGDVFTTNVSIKSDEIGVTGFKLYIQFDPNKLKALGSEYSDTYFTLNSGVTINQSAGEIIVEGTAQDDARSINRSVGTIDFSIDSTGPSTISISQSSPESVVADTSSNTLTTVVNLEVMTGDETPITQTPTSIVTKPGISELPKNDFTDVSQYLPAVGGSIVLLVGLWMVMLKRTKDDDIF